MPAEVAIKPGAAGEPLHEIRDVTTSDRKLLNPTMRGVSDRKSGPSTMPAESIHARTARTAHSEAFSTNGTAIW